MSKVVKGAKKVFKKVTKVVKKIWKPVAIAAAVYFTGGLALSAFPATSAFAASLPGFAGGGVAGLGIGAGKVAGAGIFSKVAGAIGLGGGLAKGAAAAGAMSAGGAMTTAGSVYGQMAASVAGGAGSAAGGVAATAARTGLSFADKLLLAKAGTDFIGGLMQPTPQELMAEQHKWETARMREQARLEQEAADRARQFPGAFYGVNADGSSAPQPDPTTGQIPASPPPRSVLPLMQQQEEGVKQPRTVMENAGPMKDFSLQQPRQLMNASDFRPRGRGVRYL